MPRSPTPSPAPTSDRRPVPRPALLAVSALATCAAIYWLTAARYVLGGDNAEFLTLAERGGVAHPSGYPLYVLYLRALSWLPAGSPAHVAALATSLLGLATVALLYLAARRWGATPLAAAAAALVFALSPRAWLAATHAEVFSLNALIAAAILWLAVAPRPHGARRVIGLGLLAGLGLSDHLSIVLMVPIGALGVYRGLVEADRRLGVAGLGLAALLLGLIPYLYLPVAASHDYAWSWGSPDSLGGLLDHFLRRDYGTAQLGLTDTGGTPLRQLWWLAEHLVRDLTWLPLVALPVGLWWALRRRAAPAPGRAAGVALVATLIATGPLLVSRFHLGWVGVSASVIERFYLLPELVSALIVALGLTALGHFLRRFEARAELDIRPAVRRAAVGVVLAALAALAVFRTEPEVSEHHSPAVERYLRNTLGTAPIDAVVLGTGDHRLFGFAYLQAVQMVRTDVTYLDPNMLRYDWYRERAERRLGFDLPDPVHGSLNTAKLAAAVLYAGRPLCLTDLFTPRIVRTFPSYPYGTLIRVLPAGQPVPPPAEVEAQNRRLFESYDLRYPVPRDHHTWAWQVHTEYARPWLALAEMFRRLGDTAHARELEDGLASAYR